MIKLGIVGVGKIVRDQHLPAIEEVPGIELCATASRNASIKGVAAFDSIQQMVSGSELDAVALCMPPQFRFEIAKYAIEVGLHVLLEKPPGSTVNEVAHLADLAKQRNVSLYTTWHSRHAPAVDTARSILDSCKIEHVFLTWKENVRKWHPGQDWIWQAGGLGVFDPGINGLSILTHCLTDPLIVKQSELQVPKNKDTPIAANIVYETAEGLRVDAEFDWSVRGDEEWNIDFLTDKGLISLREGGAALFVDQQLQSVPKIPNEIEAFVEYYGIYQEFADLISNQKSRVDIQPLQIVADSFLLAASKAVDAYIE